MNASRAAVVVLGMNLIAVWAAAAAGARTGPPAGQQATPVATEDRVLGQARSSLLAASLRLEAHLRDRRPSAPALRDPFQFGGEALDATRRAQAAGPASDRESGPDAAAAALPAEPLVVLQGMAESRDGESVVRTAILRAGDDLVLATLGTRVGGRYEVVGLTSDAVELEHLVDHSRLTCRMR